MWLNEASKFKERRRHGLAGSSSSSRHAEDTPVSSLSLRSCILNIAQGMASVGARWIILVGVLLCGLALIYAGGRQSGGGGTHGALITSTPTEIRYIVVGPRYDQHFVALAIWSRLLEDANPDTVRVRIVAFPSDDKFESWLTRRKSMGHIPSTFQGTACVFKGDPTPKFLGGISDLRSDASIKFLKSKKLSVSTTLSPTTTVPEPVEEDDDDENNNDDAQVITDGEDDIDEEQQQQQQQQETHHKPIPPSSLTPKPQVRLKNKIVTGYRAAEGKSFTNYRPLGQVLTSATSGAGADQSSKYRGWQFLYQAPALASVVLVQDTTSAGVAFLRNKNSLVNNIGWGGQSCLGGTKNSQIECRTKKAREDGCAYETLGIQPPQYRLWIREECEAFFASGCTIRPRDALWILKPSGGQHGVGMSVHKGCDELRTLYPSCPAPVESTRRFVMEYLEPVLLDGHKFDVRSYILIASMEPLMVFYHDGFVRRATNKYSRDDLKDKTAHITNAVQQNAKDDHFWDFARLSQYLHSKAGFPPDFMTTTFRDTARHVSNFVFQAARAKFKPRKGKFQLFAVDWIVDSSGRSHMLEVNANPLVTNYPVPGFPQVWIDLMDLVMNLHVSPDFFTQPFSTTSTPPFSYNGWELVFNELEEKALGVPYNSCRDFSAFQKQSPPPRHDVTNTESLEQITAAIVSATRDDDLIREEEKFEDAQAVGSDEIRFGSCPTLSLEDEQAGVMVMRGTRVAGEVTFRDSAINCTTIKETSVARGIVQDCVLGFATDEETPFRMISSPDRVLGPVIMLVAGMHGNEGAGIIAARHVAQYWTVQKGVLIVVEKLNVRGVKSMSRLVPSINGGGGNSNGGESYDLNRAFPTDIVTSTTPLARLLWRLMQQARPTLLIDLHEARSYFASSAKTHELVNANVGSTSKSRGGGVSKGNTVIASADAEPLARVLVNKANGFVKDEDKKFLILVPPIEGGLANKVSHELHTRSLVCETTLLLPRETRVRHHLFFVSTALRVLGVVKVDFDFDAIGPPPDLCVSQTKKGLCAVMGENDDDDDDDEAAPDE